MNALHGWFLDTVSGLGIALRGEVGNVERYVRSLENGEIAEQWRDLREVERSVAVLSGRMDAMACSEGLERMAVRLSKTAPLELSPSEIVLLLFDRWACRCHSLIGDDGVSERRRHAAAEALCLLGPLRAAFDEFRRAAAKMEEEKDDDVSERLADGEEGA